MNAVAGGSPSLFEPGDRTIRAAREQLQIWGYKLSDEAVRRLVRMILESEGPRIQGEARQRAEAALRALEQAHQAAVRQLAQHGRNLAGGPAASGEAEAAATGQPRDEAGNAAELVRQKLAEAAQGEGYFSAEPPKRRGLFGFRRRWGKAQPPEPEDEDETDILLFTQGEASTAPPRDRPAGGEGRPFLRRPPR
ncbi:MAG TPA: hypothetical protein VNK43_02400 [Gemmatimonadales bacterium]|nr:hypothetical protein [Gemmatimonadales bacterium]